MKKIGRTRIKKKKRVTIKLGGKTQMFLIIWSITRVAVREIYFLRKKAKGRGEGSEMKDEQGRP